MVTKLTGLAVCSLAILLMLFAGCKGGLGGSQVPSGPEDGEGSIISLSKQQDVKFKDETADITLTANLLPGVLELADISWAVDDPTIAAISYEGGTVMVKPQGKIGSALVTATLVSKEGMDLSGLELSASYTLTVLDLPTIAVNNIGSIMLNPENAPADVQISAGYTPVELSAYSPRVVWDFDSASYGTKAALSGTEGASVTLTAKAAGTNIPIKAKLTILEREFTSAATNFTVSAFDNAAVQHTSITIANPPTAIIQSDTSAEFEFSFEPAYADGSKILWSVSDTVLTVQNGSAANKKKLLAGTTKTGSFKVTAKSQTNESILKEFNVQVNPLTVTVTKTSGNDVLYKGDKATFTASVNAANKTVTWSVSEGTAAVDKADNGTTTVATAKAVKTANTNVTVKAVSSAVTSVSGTASVKVNPPQYTVIYKQNHDSSDTKSYTEPAKRTYGTAEKLKTLTQCGWTVKEGYFFANWNTLPNGTGTSYGVDAAVDIEPSAHNGTVTLYAIWVTSTLTLGDTGPGGGKIFYKDTAGFGPGNAWHYLEAASNKTGILKWASSNYANTYIGTATAIGTGKANTDAILSVDANAPAAKACKDYRGGGKDDWFMPSRDELTELYNNKSYVGMDGEFYASSSESSSRVWYRWFYDGTTGSNGNKRTDIHCRAIRAF